MEKKMKFQGVTSTWYTKMSAKRDGCLLTLRDKLKNKNPNNVITFKISLHPLRATCASTPNNHK